MKYHLIIIVFLLSNSAFVSIAKADTIPALDQDLKEKVSQIETQITELSSEVDQTKSERGYITWVTGLYTASIVVISLLLAFIVPAGIRKKQRRFKGKVNSMFKEYKSKIDGTNILANRTMYELAIEKRSYFVVVWGGRWLRAIFDSDNDITKGDLLEDIVIILKQILRLFEKYGPEREMQLVSFKSLGGVIENYQIISQHKDKRVKDISREILRKIFQLKKDYNTVSTVDTTTLQAEEEF